MRAGDDMTNDIRKVVRHTGRQLFGVGFVDDLRARRSAAIAEFQQRRAELDQAEQDLYAVWDYAAQNETDSAEWTRVFNKIHSQKSAMDAIAGAVSTVADYWNSATDFFGLSGMRSSGALGALPLAFPLTLGAVLALVAAATTAISAAYGFIRYINSKTDRYSQLIAAGVDPVEANKEATDTAVRESGYTLAAHVERIVLYGAIALLGVFLVPKLLRK